MQARSNRQNQPNSTNPVNHTVRAVSNTFNTSTVNRPNNMPSNQVNNTSARNNPTSRVQKNSNMPQLNLMNALMQMNMVIDAYHDAGGDFVLPNSVKLLKSLETLGLYHLQDFLPGSFNGNTKSDYYQKFTMKINNDDDTIVHWIFKNVFIGNTQIAAKKSIEMLDYILENCGDNINIKPNFHGNLPIHFIPNKLDPGLFEKLLACHVSLKHLNTRTLDNIWHIIGNKVYPENINAIDTEKIFTMLIKHGVNIKSKNLKGEIAKEKVLSNKNPKIAQAMLKALQKETVRMFLWIIWLQDNQKLKSKKLIQINKLSRESQYNILSFLIHMKA